jgi:hypothetical protein
MPMYGSRARGLETQRLIFLVTYYICSLTLLGWMLILHPHFYQTGKVSFVSWSGTKS